MSAQDIAEEIKARIGKREPVVKQDQIEDIVPVKEKKVKGDPTLLRSKPFAEIFGWANVRYEQNGQYFDIAGNWLQNPPKDE